MTNNKLGADYKKRAKGRMKAIKVLLDEGLFADVVGECQKACELALKGIIRDAGHSIPLVHDVSETLKSVLADLPKKVQSIIDELCDISKQLRRDRELAFYGSEDITPSDFYTKEDAAKAIRQLNTVLSVTD